MKKFFSCLLLLCILCSVISPIGFAEGTEQKENLTFEGKTISILGDSISTYKDVSSGEAANTSNSTIRDNRPYYYDGRTDVTLNDTWWVQAANTIGAEILVNNSYSNTSIFSPFSDNEELGYLSRPYNLHDNTGDNAGQEPDIIAVYIGTNDISFHKSKLGSYEDIDFDTLITETDGEYIYQKPTTSAEAYAIMIHKIISTYKEAEVYCFTNLPRGKRAADDASATELLNESITKIAQHFECFVVDLYNESGINADERIYSRYFSDSYLHPNKKGMEVIENIFTSTLYKNSKYSPKKNSFEVKYNLDDVIITEGNIKNAFEGDVFKCTLTRLEYGAFDIKVTMGNRDITSYSVDGNIISIPSVEGDISISASVLRTPRTFKNYRYERKGNLLVNYTQYENYDNDITKLNADTYKTQEPITAYYDKPWSIVFRANISNADDVTVLSTNQKSGFSLVLDGKRNILGFCDKENLNEIFGIDLNKYNISQTDSHTYKITNSHNIDGTNAFTVFVDTKEIGMFDSKFQNGVLSGNDISRIYEEDLNFNLIGTKNCDTIEYIQIWGDNKLINHGHIWSYPQETSPKCEEPGATTYTCDCGTVETFPDIPPTGHKEGDWIISKEASAIEPGEEYRECIICGKVTQTRSIPQLKCDKPVISSITNTDCGIKVTWADVKGADSYRVYRHLKNGKWEYLCTTTATNYIDTNVKNGYWYYYTVRAVNEAGYSDFYSTGNVIQYLQSPVFKKAQNTNQGITLSWNPVNGAQGYYLYKKSGNNNWQYYCRVNSTSYTDKNVNSGTTYSYRIKACRNRTVSGFYYDGITISRLSEPILKTPINTDSGIKIFWNKVNGATGYFVYRLDGGYWKYIGKTSGTAFTDTDAVPGKICKYTVKAYCINGSQSSYSASGVSYMRLATPHLYNCNSSTSGISFKWYGVKGSNGYYIYRKTANGTWQYLGKTTNTKYTDKTAKKGTTYTYTVKAYSGSYVSNYSGIGISAKR